MDGGILALTKKIDRELGKMAEQVFKIKMLSPAFVQSPKLKATTFVFLLRLNVIV